MGSWNQIHEHFPAPGLILHYVDICPSHVINSERQVTKPAGPTGAFFTDGNLKPPLPPPVEIVHFFPGTSIHVKPVKSSEFLGLFPSPLVKKKTLNIHYPKISNCLIDFFPFKVSQKNQKAQSFCSNFAKMKQLVPAQETWG